MSLLGYGVMHLVHMQLRGGGGGEIELKQFLHMPVV